MSEQINFDISDQKNIIALARTFDNQGHLGGTVVLNEIELVKFARCLASIINHQSIPARRVTDTFCELQIS